MIQKDNGFKKRLLETFKIEAAEHLKSLSSGLLDLEKAGEAGERASIIEKVFRESHSLKGSARVVSMTDVESVCQLLESVFSALKGNELTLSPEIFDGLHAAVYNLGELLAAGSQSDLSKASQARTIVQILENILKGTPAVQPRPPSEQAGKTGGAASEEVEMGSKPISRETVRIAVSRLESLLLEAEELLAAKQAASRLSRDLAELETEIASWEEEWRKISARVILLRYQLESVNTSRTEKIGPGVGRLIEFLDWNQSFLKSLESKIATLCRSSRREGNSLGVMVDNLTQDMKKVLMSPFSSLTELFPKFVRDLAREQDKEIELLIRGEEMEIDRRILEQLKDPLLHIIRNCADHGVERSETRQQKNKPPRGTIAVSISPKGSSNIEVIVSDDGQGIDVQKVRTAAVRNKAIAPEDADKLGETELLSLIYRSGVTTSSNVTDISGRGLGLAIAREKIEKLRGTISVESQPDLGTTFRIVVPLTLAQFRGLLVRSGGQMLVIPTANVDRAVRVKKEAIQTLEGRPTIQFAGKAVSLVNLADVLGLSQEERPDNLSGYLPVLVLRFGETQLAFLVDEIINEQEVLVKSLGKQLSRVRNVAGASLLNTGKIAPVINVADLIKSAVSGRAIALTAVQSPEATQQRLILVAEDSITARTLLKNILETVGYRVRTAVDGLDAFTQLKTEKFDLVVSDVDMPRLNGFDLTVKIRGDKQLAPMPVVLVTALESRENRERGIDVGANAYIVKSSFDQGDLLETIRRLI